MSYGRWLQAYRRSERAFGNISQNIGDRSKGNGAKSTEAWHTVLDDLMGKTWWRQEILAVDDAFMLEADAPHMLRARSTMQRKTGSDASIPVNGIQERIDRIHWYHEFDFGNGLRAEVKTPDAQSHRRLWRFIQSELDKIDFTGKSVLDIGCWDGYWSFYAERKGAARVLATDDSSQNWTGGAGFHLAKELLNSSVECDLQLSIYDLCRLDTKFDIILCLGVLYHLLDPFYGLAQIRHRCHPNSIIILEGDVFFGLIESREQSAALYSRDVRRAPRFVPDPDTLRFLVNAAYFTVTTESVFPLSTTTDAEILRGVNRMLLACQPFYGRNMCHEYQPPFGLKEYDARAGLTPERWSDLYLSPGEAI